jgi:hypothetical protein
VQYAEFQVIFDENNSICMLCRIKDDISFPGYIFKMKNKDKLLVCTKSVGIVLGSIINLILNFVFIKCFWRRVGKIILWDIQYPEVYLNLYSVVLTRIYIPLLPVDPGTFP